MPRASIKNEKSNEDLRRQGDSKEKLISELRNS
ncbi:MAG: hypothetical protein JWR34_5650 [Mycobacterium sp.]|nr:hypothetical protein [Mycobacterium sp.]